MNRLTSSSSCTIAVLLPVAVWGAVANAGETLYNGIVLPDEWPPRIAELTREPMSVPYLEHRPAVVPMDVGRQLFVDDFLIEQTTLERVWHRATFHPACPVLRPDKPWEREPAGSKPCAMVFSDGVWYDPADSLFKMWYMGGYCRATCYATSKDGIHWDKPALDVVPGTNVVLVGSRDSNAVWLDLKESDPAHRYKMFIVTQRRDKKGGVDMVVRYSADGIHWGQPVAEGWAGGDRSTIFYNPFHDRWVYSLRAYAPPLGRSRMYVECTDLADGMRRAPELRVPWTGADRLDPHNPNAALKDVPPELYNLDVAPYESIMLGLFSIWQGQPRDAEKRNEVLVGFSRDGFHWYRPDRRPFVGVNETDGAWNWGNVQSAGGGCLVVGDQLYFYVSGRGRGRTSDPASTGLAILRRDGFASMDAGDKTGTLTTRLLTFKGKYLFLNVDAPGGELRVEVLDRDGKVISPFDKEQCIPVATDSTMYRIRWADRKDLSSISGNPVRFRFHLQRGRLYSFWVSPDENGASRGYVAAGGPGYTGPADTVGGAARAAADATMTMRDGCTRTASASECPAWARETVPVWVQLYRGRYGLPEPYPRQKDALGHGTAGIDLWQANHFIACRAETARYLYEAYTPLTVRYRKGTMPVCESIVAKYTAGISTDREKALALLIRAVPEQIGHPSIPPYSADCPPDRALSEEDLLTSGKGWCNEQARVFVRLCQVAGIPARMVFLFYADKKSGHVIAEFYADGRWCMADSSWGCAFPGADGKLMSAAQCHADADSKRRVQEGYLARARDLLSWPDEMLVGRRYAGITDAAERVRRAAEDASRLREGLRSGTAVGTLGEGLWAFGVMNLPLP
jgi:hypothetical protein